MILRQTLFAFLGQKRSKWVKLGQRSKILGEWLVLHPDFCWIDLCTELFVERGWGPRNGGGLAATKVIAISEWSHGGSPVQGAQLHNAKAQASKRPRGAMVSSVPLYGWGWIRMDWAHDIYIYLPYTRKTPVSLSPKLSFVPFKFCSSCRRNAFFSIFKFKKMHFDLRPPMNLSTSILPGGRSDLWPCKKNVLHFRWQARNFLRFWQVLDCLFLCFFLAGCGAGSFIWGGGGGGIITSFRSRPMMLRSWLSSVLC